jgi:hypothetical protein
VIREVVVCHQTCKKETYMLLTIIDELDVKAESSRVTVAEREALRDADDLVIKLRRDEETKWDKCAKVKHVSERQ